MTDQPAADTPIDKLPLSTLYDLQSAAAAALANAKANVASVSAEIARRFGESAKQALAQANKTHGTVSLPLQDGYVAKGEVKQSVKWDSAALMALAQTMPWERVVALFKIEFSMTETIYKGISALSPDLRAKIDAARTTQIGEPSVKLVRE